MRALCLFALTICLGGTAALGVEPFSKGLPRTPNYFPVAVWLQDTANAERYRAIGINLYVGLWRGPTEEQLDALDKAGMRLICGQNARSLRFIDRSTIVGWMHGDEPDNAQSLPGGKGYGPPISAETIIKGYESIRKADPNRPVILNLGQGVAWDGWFGRGVRTNHPEDYPQYIKGCDIVSFDIYPAVHDHKDIAGKLWYVPKGVARLKEWSHNEKPVWSCIETTRISNPSVKPSPAQVRSEVWMALIEGAQGIIYFAHEFKPKFIEAGLLADKEIAQAVGAINRRIHELAPVLNSPTIKNGPEVKSSNANVPIKMMMKQHDGKTYLFVAAMREGETNASFTLPNFGNARIEVLDENRQIDVKNGQWADRFVDYGVHLYRIEKQP